MLDLPRILARLRAEPGAAPAASSRAVEVAVAQAIEFRGAPRERREILLRNSRQLHTIAFAKQLLALAAEVAGDSPSEALEILDAFEILAELPAFDGDERHRAAIAELSALALVRRAVNMTKLGQLAGAGIVLDLHRELASATVATAGEYHEARAHHAAVRLQLEEALAELTLARQLYESIADQHLVGRVLVAKAFAFGEARDYEASITSLLEACEKVDPARDRRLALALCFNLARALHDAGRSSEALDTIALTRDFVQVAARRLDRFHLRWLEAALLAERGYFGTSASVYLEVATAFGDLGLAIEVSEVALEAVESFIQAGRGRELLPLLMLAERVLRAYGFDEERLAAWLALQAGVAAQIVTAAAISAARSSTHPS